MEEGMFFLERKEPYAMPNILGNHSMPVHTFRWKAIATCETREPLEEALSDMNKATHRIISNQPE
jgi:hypothetical protein